MINADLLSALLSPDGVQRSQAEAMFNAMALDEKVSGLMSTLMSYGNYAPEQQLLSAVLLRRNVLKVEKEEMLKELVGPLLQCFTDENRSTSFRLQIGHCIAGICASIPSILPSILSTVEPAISRFDIPSLKLLVNMAEQAPLAFSSHVVAHLPGLVGHSIQMQSAVSQRPDVILEVLVTGAIATTMASNDVGAIAWFVSPNPEELVIDETSAAAKLGPALSQVLAILRAANDENSIHASLQHLVQAASLCPSLLASSKPVLESVISTCLQLAGTNSDNYELRLAALQVLASLASVGDLRRRVFVAHRDLASTIIGQVVPLCAHLVVSGIEDDIEDWASEPAALLDEDGSGWDNDQVSRHAEILLGDFLQNFGGAALNATLPLVREFFSKDDWKCSRAGLAIVEVCLSATPVSLTPHIPTSLDAALSLADSPNLRVQWQAIRLLGALCENDKIDVRKSKGQQVLEKIARAITSPCNKICAMALLSLVSYCRGGQNDRENEDVSAAVVPYLPDVLGALMNGPLSLTGIDSGSICVRVRYAQHFSRKHTMLGGGLLDFRFSFC